MDALLQDIRFAFRMLRKSPWFTLTAVVTLGLGIGANAAIFTIANSLLFSPPPQVQHPEQVVAIYTSDYSGPRYGASSWPDYIDFRRLSADVLSGTATYSGQSFTVTDQGASHRTYGEIVSGNYFGVLGLRPVLGRFFLPVEDQAPTAPAIVIGYGMWQRVFGQDSSVVGRTVRLNGQPVTVIGVAPPQFVGSFRGLQAELWTAMLMNGMLAGSGLDLDGRGSRGLRVIGRLAPGVTVAAAQARFNVIANQMHVAYGDNWSDVHQQGRALTVLRERDTRIPPQFKGPVIGFVGMMMAVVALVLLICCANVANLLLARAAGREREISVRLALGAKRSRLIRLLLTESIVLASLGGAAGLALATWATGLIMHFRPPVPVPIALDLTPDARVFTFTLLVTVVTAVLFGLMPARRATRVDLLSALKSGGGAVGAGRQRARLRDALVIGQVAVSMVLLVMSGLFLRSLAKAQGVHPGFDPKGLVLFTGEFSLPRYDSVGLDQFYGTLERQARALPGVTALAFAESVPLTSNTVRRGVSIDGYQRQPGEDLEFHANLVSAGYFGTMRIPMIKGREFAATDRVGAPLVAIVNQAFAERFWPGQDAIGKRIGREGAWRTVIGVATTGKYASLGEDPRPSFYMPLAQQPSQPVLHLRTSNPAATIRALQSLAKGIDPDLPVHIVTMDEQLGVALFPQTVGATLLGIFGSLGLLIAAIGLYGVLAFTVAQRTREIGVRMALGAAASDVRRLIVGRALTLTGIGAGIGLVLAFVAGRLASRFLFGVAPADPMTFVIVPLVLGAVALLAGWLPTRRAGRIDPIVALRSE